MGTYYTDKLIENNLDFKQFATMCMRAFGACIMMRDDPLDTPVPEKFEPSPWHKEELKKSEEKFTFLQQLKTETKKIKWAVQEIKKELVAAKAYKEKEDEKPKIKIYQKMLKKVEKWNPPTDDHKDFKRFMKQQLEDTLRFDNSSNSYWKERETTLKNYLKNPLQYYDDQVEKVNKDIAYHERHWKEEVERTETRNQWMKQLRESL